MHWAPCQLSKAAELHVRLHEVPIGQHALDAFADVPQEVAEHPLGLRCFTIELLQQILRLALSVENVFQLPAAGQFFCEREAAEDSKFAGFT